MSNWWSKKAKRVSVLVGLITVLFSCSKEEGEGGLATITGSVGLDVYDEVTGELLSSGPAADVRVYIVYGDNTGYDDDVRTKYDGTFKFEYLYKGDYEVYTYSECLFDKDDCPDEIEARIVKVDLGSNNAQYHVPKLLIKRFE